MRSRYPKLVPPKKKAGQQGPKFGLVLLALDDAKKYDKVGQEAIRLFMLGVWTI